MLKVWDSAIGARVKRAAAKLLSAGARPVDGESLVYFIRRVSSAPSPFSTLKGEAAPSHKNFSASVLL